MSATATMLSSRPLRWQVALVVASFALIFVVDVASPLGRTVPVLYLVPVILAALHGDDRLAVASAAGATALTVARFGFDAQGGSLDAALWNRPLVVLVAWVGGGAMVMRRRQLDLVAGRRRAEGLADAVITASPDAILVVEPGGTIRWGNPAAHTLLGYEAPSLTRVRFDDVILPAPAGDPAVPGAGAFTERTAVRRDGARVGVELRWSDVDGDPTLFVASMRDLTERRQFEERLKATQRLEAIGRLAGGVAHDFNNLLAIMLSHLSLARDGLSPGHAVLPDLLDVEAAAERARDLTRQLLAFSRRQVIEPQRLDLNALVESTVRMLRRVVGEHIEVQLVCAPDLWTVVADPGQLEQVLLNLAVNARDAMADGGRLLLETANVTLSGDYAQVHPEVDAGDYVMLAVTDTGVGMTDAVRVRIFEPFFTTKEPGAGTGLGLATVYGIVKQARGHVWVYSEPGTGTTFRVYLPRAVGTPEPLRRRVAAPSRGGSEVVVVVEDEAALRRVMVRVLSGAGYTVVEASNGADAMLKVETLAFAFDLLVTDVVMPQMGGRELVDRLSRVRADLKVLYLSGYTENAIVHQGVLDPEVVFLQKPFTPQDLLRRVRERLDAPG